MIEQWDELRSASRQQLWLRGAIVVATVLFVVASGAAGDGRGWADPWLVIVAPVLALLAAVQPHTFVPAVLMVYLVWTWVGVAGIGTEQAGTPWSLLGAACLLVIHTAAALAASVPAPARLPAALWRRYLPRVAVVLGATIGVWAAARFVAGTGTAGASAAMLLGLAVVAAAALWHFRWVGRWAARQP